MVACTDMERVNIMLTRIREQLEAVPQLKGNGTLSATARPIPLSRAAKAKTLEQQLQVVADEVTHMAMQELGCKYAFDPKEKKPHVN